MYERTPREGASCCSLPQKLRNRGSIDAGYTDLLLKAARLHPALRSPLRPTDRRTGADRSAASRVLLWIGTDGEALPPDAARRDAGRCTAMNQSDEFLKLTGKELQFVSDLILRLDQGSLDPVGLDREAAVLFLREVAAERRRLVDRLKSRDGDSGAACTGAPV